MDRRPLRAEVEIHELDGEGETALFDKQGARLLVLNAVGAGVWYLSDGTRTVEEIVDEVMQALPADRARVTEDVQAFLRELETNGLVTLK